MTNYLLGIGTVFAYYIVGLAIVWILTKISPRATMDVDGSVIEVLLTMTIWPAVPFIMLYMAYARNRREKARQASITDLVNKGQYTPEYARDMLKWKGNK